MQRVIKGRMAASMNKCERLHDSCGADDGDNLDRKKNRGHLLGQLGIRNGSCLVGESTGRKERSTAVDTLIS